MSDDRRRKRYDVTGSTAETLEDDDDFDWLKFYREQFQDVVNQENIDKISDSYKNSPEERRDLLKVYTKYKGRLEAIYQNVMLSDILEDDDRFRRILDEEIAKGTIESFEAYERANNDADREKAKKVERKRREDFDKNQAKKQAKADSSGKSNSKPKAKKKDAGGMGDLAALIAQRQKARHGNFFDHLEAKYAPPGRGGKRATPMDEPPEEMFEAMGARKKQRASGRSKTVKDVDMADELEEEDVGESEEDEEDEAPRKAKKAKKPRSRKSKAAA